MAQILSKYDVKSCSRVQYHQRMNSLKHCEKTVKFDLAGEEVSMQFRLCHDSLSYSGKVDIVELELDATEIGEVSIFLSIESLNRFLHQVSVPQIIDGVSEDFLSSMVELLVAGVFEPIFGQALALKAVNFLDETNDKLGYIEQPESGAQHYQLCDEGFSLVAFTIVGVESASLLCLDDVSPSLINISIPGKLGLARVNLAEEDFQLVEQQDLLPMHALEVGALFLSSNGLPLLFAVSQDVDGSDVEVPATEYMVYKPTSICLSQVLSGAIDPGNYLKKRGLNFIDGPGCVLSGFVLSVSGQYFFSVLDKVQL